MLSLSGAKEVPRNGQFESIYEGPNAMPGDITGQTLPVHRWYRNPITHLAKARRFILN